jgi:hypothetical protein
MLAIAADLPGSACCFLNDDLPGLTGILLPPDPFSEMNDEMAAMLSRYGPADWDAPCEGSGGTVGDLIHHLADVHLEGYDRFSRIVSEERPLGTPSHSGSWYRLASLKRVAPEVSLELLLTTHRRWDARLAVAGPRELSRRIRHPRHDRELNANEFVAIHLRHGWHHLTQLRTGLRRTALSLR